MADGSGKLAEGGTKLTSGLEDLQTGLASLGQGLGNASDQLKSVSTESKNAEILSNLLNLSKTDNDQVPVNGIAIAPYMISVALFLQQYQQIWYLRNCLQDVIQRAVGLGWNLELK